VQRSRNDIQQLAADFLKAAVRTGCFQRAQDRPHSLRCQGGVLQVKDFRHHGAAIVDQHSGVRVAATEGIYAVKMVVGTPVPEAAELEDGIDRRRCVPWRGSPCPLAIDDEGGAVGGAADFAVQAEKLLKWSGTGIHALRGGNVIGVKCHRFPVQWIREYVEREIG